MGSFLCRLGKSENMKISQLKFLACSKTEPLSQRKDPSHAHELQQSGFCQSRGETTANIQDDATAPPCCRLYADLRGVSGDSRLCAPRKAVSPLVGAF